MIGKTESQDKFNPRSEHAKKNKKQTAKELALLDALRNSGSLKAKGRYQAITLDGLLTTLRLLIIANIAQILLS